MIGVKLSAIVASRVSRQGKLTNLLYIILIIAFIKTVTFKRGSLGCGNFM